MAQPCHAEGRRVRLTTPERGGERQAPQGGGLAHLHQDRPGSRPWGHASRSVVPCAFGCTTLRDDPVSSGTLARPGHLPPPCRSPSQSRPSTFHAPQFVCGVFCCGLPTLIARRPGDRQGKGTGYPTVRGRGVRRPGSVRPCPVALRVRRGAPRGRSGERERSDRFRWSPSAPGGHLMRGAGRRGRAGSAKAAPVRAEPSRSPAVRRDDSSSSLRDSEGQGEHRRLMPTGATPKRSGAAPQRGAVTIGVAEVVEPTRFFVKRKKDPMPSGLRGGGATGATACPPVY